MRLPTVASMSAFSAWAMGLALAGALIALPFVAVLIPFPMPFPASLYVIPVSVALVTVYALTVSPRLFAASGVLLGVAPFLASGVIDGLQRCARFNRSPPGGCEADPTSQVVLMVVVYVAALLVTGAALLSVRKAT